MIVASLSELSTERKLPLQSWLHYSYTPLTQILFGYVYVLFSIGGFASAAFGVDTLTFGMMMDICTQLKILRYRLRNVPRTIEKILDKSSSNEHTYLPKLHNLECNMLAECIQHHCNIFELADLLNATFSSMIFSQFAISSSVFCFTVFELTKLPMFSLGFVYTGVYFSCMMAQIFLYCWFGNNVILQSIDVANAVYDMDWSSLSIGSQKMLLMILIRALKPIQLTSGYVIVLSIDSYNNLMKSSYSVYNVLSRSSE